VGSDTASFKPCRIGVTQEREMETSVESYAGDAIDMRFLIDIGIFNVDIESFLSIYKVFNWSSN
jgi:hypothetical protein